MSMNLTLFAGCSYTAGDGFDLKKDEPNLWVNLLHKNVSRLNQTKLLNVARGGRSNSRIFQDAVFYISQGNVEYAFIAWSSFPRFEIELGCELYDTYCLFAPNAPLRDHNINGITYTKRYLQKIRDRFITLPHCHYEIVNLVYYVNSLTRVAEKFNTQLFFINALCSWDHQYFTQLNNVLPSAYTPFTQNIINVNNRNDEEICLIYKKMHSEYESAGGIQAAKWINLYNSLFHNKIDVNSDNLHPGIQSNQNYFKLIKSSLQTLGYV